MPLIIGRVVDEHSDFPMRLRRLIHCRPQCSHVSNVAGQKQWPKAMFFVHLIAELCRIRSLDERDLCSLGQKPIRQGSADTRTTTSDEN